MMYLGDYPTGATVRIPWNTNGATGAAITRSANGTVRIYKNSSTTERSSASGVTDNEDWDTITGIHMLTIDLSDNTDAGFYAVGSDYAVAVTGQTIDGVTVSAFIGAFSIGNRIGAGVRFKQNTAFTSFQFRMTDAVGTAVTGLVNGDFSVKTYSIAGGANGTIAGTITEDAATNGYYLVNLTASELNGAMIRLSFLATGTIRTELTIVTNPVAA